MTGDKRFDSPALDTESWEIQIGSVWLRADDEDQAREAFAYLNAMLDEIVRLRIWRDKAIDALARVPRMAP